jgi:hypothetical protein
LPYTFHLRAYLGRISVLHLDMQIEKLKEDKSFWFQNDGVVLMTWSIFNPNGPTLSCIGSMRTEDENVQAIFYRWLHFLKDESYILGYIDERDENFNKNFAEILENAFFKGLGNTFNDADQSLVNCIPSIVTNNFTEDWSEFYWNLLFNASGIQQDDWGRELYYLKKYTANLFDRAGEEVKEALQEIKDARPPDDFIKMQEIRHSRIETFTDKTPVEYESKPMSKEAFEFWRQIISEHKFKGKALNQFAMAWVGAISMLSKDMPVITQFEDVRDFLVQYKHEIWDQEYTTEKIKEIIGVCDK